MTVAFLVNCEVEDGMDISEVKAEIKKNLSIQNKSKKIQSAEIYTFSAREYNPEHGGVCVYQP